jgi:phage gp46-like protein
VTTGADAVLYEDESYDIHFDAQGDIETADQLNTAILMSLFCERRAASSEMPAPELRRGWIGNVSTPGIEIGSKLWLYEQARVTKSTLNGIASEALNGLNWLVEDGIAVDIDAEATINGLTVNLTRPNSEVSTQFYKLWEGTGNAT